MISERYIQAWKSNCPWPQPHQVEQDLIISRVLCEIFSENRLSDSLAFRGGTALQKIFFKKPTRYSEDIDLVQIPREPFGPTIDLIRSKLDSWIGRPTIDRKTGRVTLKYKYESETSPQKIMKLKIETNTGEHFSVLGYQKIPFSVRSDWFSGQCEITTFSIEEIMGTKLRALYQRKKGRDLYDFAKAFEHFPHISDEKIFQCFIQYMTHAGLSVSRAQFEEAIFKKRFDSAYKGDIAPLLSVNELNFDADQAFDNLLKRVISKLPGEPWKKTSP